MTGTETEERETEENSEVESETCSQTERRYKDSKICEVSDPEMWMTLNHGDSEPCDSPPLDPSLAEPPLQAMREANEILTAREHRLEAEWDEPEMSDAMGVKIGSNLVLRGTVGRYCEAMVDKTRFVELLKGLQTPDNSVRQQAETMYQQAKQAEPDNLIIGMMTVLGSADVDEGVRRHDCVLLRQLVTRGSEKDFVYARITDAHKQEVANELLRRYEQEKSPAMQKKIGEVVSKLAEYDDPRGSLAPGNPSGWPALLPQVFRMADTSTASSIESCESALRLLKDCVPTLKDHIVEAKQQLGQIIQNGLQSPQVKHKVATFLLVCEIVTETEKKAWAPLLSTVGVLVQLFAMARVGQAARTAALWLRCDLRLDDNLALKAAAEGAQTLLPVYVFDREKFNTPTLAGARKSSARRARFLLESVQCLRRRLEKAGSGLAVALGPPQEVIPKLCNGSAKVTVTKGYCSEEQREEHLVAKRLKSAGADLQNKAEGRGQIRAPLPAPKQLPPVPDLGDLKEALSFLPTLKELGYDDDEAEEAMRDDPRGVLPFQGGEDAALARLNKWMFDDDHLKEYFDIRNGMLGEGYSSKLSPWLALGCISPRRIWSEAKRYETERRIQNKSTYWLVFELTWRDFFIYMAWSQGQIIADRIRSVSFDTAWQAKLTTHSRTPWKGSMDKLERWKEGQTGDQLVDANMRELKATGFMSNRGRQNVASFLIFDLGVDWRYGAAHFEELLLDYDPCSNWGNWVAAAGLTGQRVNKFNTRKQLSDYDPQREYVNHWLRGDGRKVQIQTKLNFAKAKEEEPESKSKGEGKRGRWGREKGKGKGGYSTGQKRSWYGGAHDDPMEDTIRGLRLNARNAWHLLFLECQAVLNGLAQAKEEDLLQECIQAFTDVATVEPDFFKAQLQQSLEPAKFMATVARTREACDSGLRGLAIEWLVSYVEKRNKFLVKSVPDFINLTLECCMSLMLEVDDSEEKLKAVSEAEKSQRQESNSPPRASPSSAPQPAESSEAPQRVWASKGITGLLENVGGRRVEEQVQHNTVLLNVCPSDVIQRVNRIFTADDNVLAGGTETLAKLDAFPVAHFQACCCQESFMQASRSTGKNGATVPLCLAAVEWAQ
eukprot:s1906_g10.t1